ncbi:ribokinase [Pedobacter sp. PWIIR3]
MKPNIIIVGSMNMDMVVRTNHIPKPGETIMGTDFLMNPGGKGANQAVAVARLSGKAKFIGKIGNDLFGRQAAQLFREEGVDTTGLHSDPSLPSGIALITVDKHGENSIVVAPGANSSLEITEVEEQINDTPEAQVMLVQLEIPLTTVAHAISVSKARGLKIILNPAPAQTLSDEFLGNIDIITPNETEAELLTGVKVVDMDSAKEAARSLGRKGITTVIITLGQRGALLYQDEKFHHIHTPKTNALDTTAAGDVFNGALAVAITEGKEMPAAVEFACRAASISVTRLGAQSSIPYRNELLLNNL